MYVFGVGDTAQLGALQDLVIYKAPLSQPQQAFLGFCIAKALGMIPSLANKSQDRDKGI